MAEATGWRNRQGGHAARRFNSIPGRRWIDVEGPAVDAAAEVGQSLEAGAAKDGDAVLTADAMMAVDDDVFVVPVGEFIGPFNELAERDEAGTRDCGEGVFVRFPDIQQPWRGGGGEERGQVGRLDLGVHAFKAAR
jgi:hypothetical protein